MHNLRSALLACFSLLSITAFAQSPDSSWQKPIVHHEFGINTTLLVKQIFNLSNNTFPTLPYDITYKRILNNNAWRFGLGITADNSKLSRSTTGSSSVPQGPDENTPTYNRSTSVFFRGGWEHHFLIERHFIICAGADLAFEGSNSASQTAFVYNNLPSYYSFQKTKIASQSWKAGGGPVAGLQFMFAKRMSLSTEIPLYVFYSNGKTVTENYTKYLQYPNSYIEQTETETETTSGYNFSVTLPVTLYLTVRF
jgi:hypothetical protein